MFSECVVYPPAWAAALAAALFLAFGFEMGRLWQRIYEWMDSRRRREG